MTGTGHDLDAIEAALRRWLAKEELCSYDPYDGLTGSFPWSLARRHRLASRLLTQAVKRSPINVRPLLGIRKRVLVKSLTDMASAALLRCRLDLDHNARAEARELLDRVRRAMRPGYAGACWALETPYVTRFTQSPGNDPNLFWTINAAITFLEAYELERSAEDLEIARSAVDFMLEDLGIVDEGDDGVWVRYFPAQESAIYNVAAMGGSFFQRVGRYTREADLVALGQRAHRFVARHQNPDGSWFYARGDDGRWVDGFHTGYILESLVQAVALGADSEIEAALRRGMAFYLERMFTPDDLPRYTLQRVYPIDIQNCAQAVQTLARLSCIDAALLERAERVARAAVIALFRWSHHTDPPMGHFIMSRGRWLTNGLPAVRWGEAPMLLALTQLRAAQHGLRPSWELTTAGG